MADLEKLAVAYIRNLEKEPTIFESPKATNSWFDSIVLFTLPFLPKGFTMEIASK